MRALLIACVLPLVAAGLPAAARDDDCGRLPRTVGRDSDPFSSYVPTIDSALSLPKEGVFAMRLRPVAEIIYRVTPERGSDGGQGGVVTLENIPAGRYRIVLSEEAWIDAVQEDARLPVLATVRATDCPGTRQSIQVEARNEALTLQVGGATASRIMIAVQRMWPFEWKW